MKYRLPFMLLALLAAACAPVLHSAATLAQPASNGIHKDEAGMLRMRPVFPAPGAEIEDARPMVTVDFSGLETEIDIASVIITLNGTDITLDADVTPVYALYQPPAALPNGSYEIRVTAKDINRQPIEPLSWLFTISAIEPLAPVAERDNTTGRLSVSTDYITARYQPQSLIDISQQFREREGMKLNTDLNFTNTADSRTIMGSFHRETQPYTDVEIDKYRFHYYEPDVKASVGHFWERWSDLTLLGTELHGVSIDKNYRSSRLQVFAGRTQDPSTSGTFRQLSAGLRLDLPRGSHTTSFMALRAYETDDPAYNQVRNPARDTLFSIMHTYKPGDHFNALVEAAAGFRKERGARNKRNQAFRFELNTVRNRYTAKLSMYKIDADYLPIAEGSSRYLRSDREGGLAGASYALNDRLTLGGEFEQYDAESTGITTKRGVAYTKIFRGKDTLTLRRTRLTTSAGTTSQTGSALIDMILPAGRVFAETRITAGLLDIDYSSAALDSETLKKQFTVNSSYRDRLGITWSWSDGDTDDNRNTTTTNNRNSALGLRWTIIPFKFTWTGNYDTLSSCGTGVDNQENRFRAGFRYVIDKSYSLNIKWEKIAYSDAVTSAYGYSQHIWRAGAEWDF